MTESKASGRTDPAQTGRIKKLQEALNDLCGGRAIFRPSPNLPDKVQETNLEDILAFESVGKGISMFEGLQRQGMELTRPDQLDEMQSRRKAMEVLQALAELRIFIVGFDGMNGRELYRTLWHKTLWEGCYVKKRHPGAVTLIDVSHRMKRSEMQQYLDRLVRQSTVH